MNSSGKNRWWCYLAELRHFLACVFFLFMPFTQALTFNVGFPLKFSELALVMLAFFYISLGKRVLLPRPVLYILSLFFFLVTVSEIVNLVWDYPYALRGYIARFGYDGDSISRYVYFLLALMSLFVSVDLFLSRRDTYIRYWIYGALAAAIYSWYLCVFSALHRPVFLLPGMINPPQTIFRGIIRCGTFLEGNLMGLYMLLSGALCFYAKNIKAGIFLLCTVFITFSTLGLVSVFVFLFLYFYRQIFTRKNLVIILPGILLIAGLALFFIHTGFYKQNVEQKLFGSADKVTNSADFSKVDRVFSIRAATRMGLANPMLGVGLANYSRHFDHYAIRGQLTQLDYGHLLRPNSKVIPNNIYVEILAECGAISLVLFLIFMALLLYYSRGEPTNLLFPALVCMLLCFIAYPSFIMIYLWSFMALPVADHVNRRRQKAAISSPNPIAPAV